MKKRVLTALLAVIMVVSLGTVSALADGSTLPTADSDGVITLTYDVTLAANAEVAAGETLNLNGFDITTSANATLVVTGGTADDPTVITDRKATSHADAGTITGALGIQVKGGYTTIEKINISVENADSGACVSIVNDNMAEQTNVTLQGLNLSSISNRTDGNIPSFAISNDNGVNTSVTLCNLNDAFLTNVYVKVTDFAGPSGIIYSNTKAPNKSSFKIESGNYVFENTKYLSSTSYVAYFASFNADCDSMLINGGEYWLSGNPSVLPNNWTGAATLSGGEYNFEPKTAYNVSFATGYAAVDNSDPNYPYIVADASAASVGGTEYDTLQEAITAADGGDINLLRNVTEKGTVTLDKNVTINTNGYKVTLLGEPAVKVLDGVTLPEVFGSFEACGVTDDGYTSYFNTLYDAIEHCDRVTLLEDANVSPLNIVKDYTLDMNGHSITANDNAINIITPVTGTPESANIVITNSAAVESVIYGGIEISNNDKVNGTVYTFTLDKNVKVSADVAMHVLGNGAEGSVTVNINGTVESTGDDAAIQGNGLRDGTVININDGAVVDGGNAAGIYHPQNGVLNINGGTVKGYTGIYMRDGKLNISGGSIIGIGDPAGHPDATGGYLPNGDALVVDNSGYSPEPPTVNITGGSFDSEKAEAVSSVVSGSGEQPITGFISGGEFSSSVSVYVEPGRDFEAYDNGTYSYHATRQEAEEHGEVSYVGADGVTVTFKDGSSVTEVYYEKNATVILPNASRSGYIFLGWRSGDKTFSAGERVVVSADVTFTAVWGNLPDTAGTYPITVADPANGAVSVSLPNASEGAVITVTAKPDGGYVLAYVTVDGQRISGSSFTMPGHAVTVSAVFVRAGLPFTDVAYGDWFYDEVAYVYANGLMEGVSDTAFEPGGGMTRAMVWAILARIDGVTVTGSNWAETARSWAMAKGISDGENASAPVTREQLVTMLYRYAGEPVVSGSLTGWADAASVSGWAGSAMTWAVNRGIITGATESTLAPADGATRAQCAAILMRYIEA